MYKLRFKITKDLSNDAKRLRIASKKYLREIFFYNLEKY
jgi:hypothetical protein